MKTTLLGLLAISVGGCATNGDSKVSVSAARSAYEAVPVDSLTSAPRRVQVSARLDKPIEQVWAYLGNHQNLIEYSDGILGEVSVDDSAAAEPQGVGTQRKCVTSDGKDRFVEKIVYYKAPYAFAYSAVENTWGLKNHLAVVSLEPDKNGGTIVRWDQYFDHMMPEMAPKVAMNLSRMLKGKVLAYLATKFGGEVLKEG